MNFHPNESALLATLPFFIHWPFSVFIGKLMDYLRMKGTITITFARKFCTYVSGISTSGELSNQSRSGATKRVKYLFKFV